MPTPNVLQEALDNLREPLFIVDSQRRCLFANRALFSFLGLPVHKESALPLEQFWRECPLGVSQGDEVASEFVLDSGATFPVRLSILPLANHSWLVRVLAGISGADESHTFHAHRLETLGMLAGGVAHDFNNLLAGILGHITYLKTILPGRGEHTESLAAIEDGAKRASGLTQQILSFSRLESGEQVADVNVCELAKGTCKLLRGAMSPDHSLECELPKSPLIVLGAEGKLAQVVVNLVMNARDALTGEGFIRLSVASVESQTELSKAFAGADLSSKRYARISVTDNGHGMSSDVIKRIFEPYFSTKKNKGTGLGLAMVRQIVQLFGGAITVQSEVGLGTTVSVYLPIVAEEAAPAGKGKKSAKSDALEHGTERVLVVDDEYPVRNVLCVSLEHLGYKVETANSGKEALEKYEAGGGYDLVLLDMIMPQLSGDQVFIELKKIDPQVQVLVISGFSSEKAVKSILNNGGLGFLQKPFTIEELSRCVRSCLDR